MLRFDALQVGLAAAALWMLAGRWLSAGGGGVVGVAPRRLVLLILLVLLLDCGGRQCEALAELLACAREV